MTMTPNRFKHLTEAYGADVARWPKAERADAAALMADEPTILREALSEANQLDEALDLWRPPEVRSALREAVVAAAPKRRRRTGWSGWLAPLGLGAGLAGACAAGVLFGAAGFTGVGQTQALDTDVITAATAGYDNAADIVGSGDAV